MLETLSEHPDTYESVDGTVHDLTGLDAEARDALARLIEFFNWHPPYPQFRTYWRDKNSPIRTFLEHGNPHRELFRTIAKDLEHRLGVAQGRIEE